MDIVIRSDVPLPKRAAVGRRRGSKYPFGELDVGQSFFMDVKPAAMRSALAIYKKKNPDRKFAVRADGTGASVWRTE